MSTLTRPFAKYVHARRAGRLLYLAGQGCRDPDTDHYAGLTLAADGGVAAYDAAAQTAGVLANVDRVLRAHGLTRRHLVDVTVFLADMQDFEAMNAVWNDFFRECAPPARTTVAVRALPGHNFVEMKAVACLDDPTEET